MSLFAGRDMERRFTPNNVATNGRESCVDQEVPSVTT
jgi:hypothetical protein